MEIRYYPNPLDQEEVIHLEGKTILDALQSAGIENKPLCVVINGECPDDVDLNYIIQDGDKIEFRTIVEGSAEDWATVVDVLTVVAVIAMVSTGVGAVYVAGAAIGGSLISGAIRKSIKPPSIKDMTPEEMAVANNDLSVAQANNQVRKLQPIPIPIGDIQFAPDVYTYPYIDKTNPNDLIIIETEYYIIEKSYLVTSFSAQVFSYGFGDFEVYKRAAGSFELTDDNKNLAGWSTIRFRSESNRPSEIPATEEWLVGIPAYAPYYIDVNPKSNASFSNVIDNDRYVPPGDTNDRTWVYFEGQRGQSVFAFGLAGNLYEMAGGAYGVNWTSCQVQVKTSKEAAWSDVLPGARTYRISNNNPDTVYFPIAVGRNLSDGGVMQVRIRKGRHDDQDNTTSKVARLNIVNPNFRNPKVETDARLPINMDGVYITSMFSTDSTTNNYVVALKAKCWVFENDEWVWKHTRNPAWWFLYFAKGGFYNRQSKAEDQVYPYSPTNCWQNYAGHPDNTELMWGGGYTLDKINIDKIIEWAQFCDDSELYIDNVLRDDTSVADVLEKIAGVGRASVVYENGKLSVIYEDKNQIPVTMFGMANILAGSFTVNYNVAELPTKIRCSFANREEDFELSTIEVDVPFADQSRLKITDVTLSGVTEPQQAQREANLLAARQFFQTRNYTWKTDHEGFMAKRGDLVYLSHDAAQYGYSGRVHRFIVDDNDSIIGFETTAKLGESSWLMIRLPNGDMKKYQCELVDGALMFLQSFPIEDGPYQLKDKRRDAVNAKTRFPNSIAEDYIFISDIKETVGKIVRISAVESLEGNQFGYTAVDEDPAMWAFESGTSIDPETFDDSIGVIEVYDASAIDLGGGEVKITWNGSDDCLFMLVDASTDSPIMINGRFSIGEKEVTLELAQGVCHQIRIVPLRVNEAVTSITKTVEICLD